ncbi:DUF1311 domain-containing protein [Yoonia sp. GPGPB17]|uniref:lysozyme inhibitor LprI family protein n=1 Tax=Yoonia sp. GPGPB17 TaxID=3026147 RepID=UPI0030BD9057
MIRGHIAIILLFAAPAFADDDWLYAPMVDACSARADQAGGPQSCIGEAAAACMQGEPDGETTVGMMFCLLDERDAWDAILNDEYQQTRDFARAMDAEDQELFPEYAVRAEQVLEAQRAWITFRDANCTMEYGVWGAGSMRQIAGADCHLQMTADRALALRAYRDIIR